ncbi:hypothetical protein EV356DRAFT_507548 [Viridothelium virens]|uniref:Uncharacterized protein n=1 Tax=Viridothelium virens TaxID=1048519 RepID=A0A6A6HKC9_VIRVR|nr:hypothetical protein EV356DRAFT_507548 [Viridothelium virens]
MGTHPNHGTRPSSRLPPTILWLLLNFGTTIGSKCWTGLYISIATLISNFDFKLTDAQAEDVMPRSDEFVIGTEKKHGPTARAMLLT